MEFVMERRFFIISGPQAAGKSTAIRHLARKYEDKIPMLTRRQKGTGVPDPRLVPLEESRAEIVHRYDMKGAIFMSYMDELEVIHKDMTRMFRILREGMDGIFLDECNVFTLAHAKAHGIDLTEGYYRQYMDMLGMLKASVIFLDVPPEVSWERRKVRYEQRHWDLPPEEKAAVMAQHKEYLFSLYPELLAIYDRLDLPKTRIDAYVPLEEATVHVEEAFRGYLQL